MSFLKITNLYSGYHKKPVLFDISLSIQKGETILLRGPNGSGKSSLLRAIYGLLRPWNPEARIWFKGQNITNSKPAELLRKGMAFIPQRNELFENMSVKLNLEIGGMQTNPRGLRTKVDKVLTDSPILKRMANIECSRLSGGERKQLSLAMALLNSPEMIMCDEPLAGINPKNLDIMLKHLIRLKNANVTLLIAEHRVNIIQGLVDREICLELGNIRSFFEAGRPITTDGR